VRPRTSRNARNAYRSPWKPSTKHSNLRRWASRPLSNNTSKGRDTLNERERGRAPFRRLGAEVSGGSARPIAIAQKGRALVPIFAVLGGPGGVVMIRLAHLQRHVRESAVVHLHGRQHMRAWPPSRSLGPLGRPAIWRPPPSSSIQLDRRSPHHSRHRCAATHRSESRSDSRSDSRAHSDMGPRSDPINDHTDAEKARHK